MEEVDGRRMWMDDGGGWKTDVDGRRMWMDDGGGWIAEVGGRRMWMEVGGYWMGGGGWKDPTKAIGHMQTYGMLPRSKLGRRWREASLIPLSLF